MNVSVAEVLAGAAAHAVPLTAECVGYLVLGAADQVLGAPRSLGAADLLLSEDGAVRVAGGRAAQAEDAERDLRAMLDALLLRASSASPGLLRASRRQPGEGIQGLVRELERALIPVNRSAAKRALSRLQRETRRALDSGRFRVEACAAEAPVTPAPAVVTPAPAVVAPAPEPAGVIPTLTPPVVAPAPALAVSVEALAPLFAVTPVPPAFVNPQAFAELSSSEPLPSVALPPVLPEPVEARVLDEVRNETVMLAAVARREPQRAEPAQLAETRPEPVVLRASQRPLAPAALDAPDPGADRGHTVPLPPVTISTATPPASAPSHTPVLGTRIVAALEMPSVEIAIPTIETAAPTIETAAPAIETPAPTIEMAAATVEAAEPSEVADASEDDELEIEILEEPVRVEAHADDEDDFIEVIFEEDERTVFSEDQELLFTDAESRESGDTTDPCPPLAVESLLPPPCAAISAEPASIAVSVEPPSVGFSEPPSIAASAEAPSIAVSAEPPTIAASAEAPSIAVSAEAPSIASSVEVPIDVAAEPSPVLPPVAVKAEPPAPEPVPSEVELAELVESALPPWTCEEAPAFEVTPPPRVALPEPRRSDVGDLLVRLGQAPIAIDELRTGLKRLAGLDLTPPPPGTESRD